MTVAAVAVLDSSSTADGESRVHFLQEAFLTISEELAAQGVNPHAVIAAASNSPTASRGASSGGVAAAVAAAAFILPAVRPLSAPTTAAIPVVMAGGGSGVVPAPLPTMPSLTPSQAQTQSCANAAADAASPTAASGGGGPPASAPLLPDGPAAPAAPAIGGGNGGGDAAAMGDAAAAAAAGGFDFLFDAFHAFVHHDGPTADANTVAAEASPASKARPTSQQPTAVQTADRDQSTCRAAGMQPPPPQSALSGVATAARANGRSVTMFDVWAAGEEGGSDGGNGAPATDTDPIQQPSAAPPTAEGDGTAQQQQADSHGGAAAGSTAVEAIAGASSKTLAAPKPVRLSPFSGGGGAVSAFAGPATTCISPAPMDAMDGSDGDGIGRGDSEGGKGFGGASRRASRRGGGAAGGATPMRLSNALSLLGAASAGGGYMDLLGVSNEFSHLSCLIGASLHLRSLSSHVK